MQTCLVHKSIQQNMTRLFEAITRDDLFRYDVQREMVHTFRKHICSSNFRNGQSLSGYYFHNQMVPAFCANQLLSWHVIVFFD